MDGTTDVTRTFHYGAPTDFDREVYTRVLMGSIDLARATFLEGTPDTRLDILARWNLYHVGLNYRHGTGHGIGAYGFIHESPTQVTVMIICYCIANHSIMNESVIKTHFKIFDTGASVLKRGTSHAPRIHF